MNDLLSTPRPEADQGLGAVAPALPFESPELGTSGFLPRVDPPEDTFATDRTSTDTSTPSQ